MQNKSLLGVYNKFFFNLTIILSLFGINRLLLVCCMCDSCSVIYHIHTIILSLPAFLEPMPKVLVR